MAMCFCAAYERYFRSINFAFAKIREEEYFCFCAGISPPRESRGKDVYSFGDSDVPSFRFGEVDMVRGNWTNISDGTVACWQGGAEKIKHSEDFTKQKSLSCNLLCFARQKKVEA
jgi:hypothetical protein